MVQKILRHSETQKITDRTQRLSLESTQWITFDLTAADMTDEFLQINLEAMPEIQDIVDAIINNNNFIDQVQTQIQSRGTTTPSAIITTAPMNCEYEEWCPASYRPSILTGCYCPVYFQTDQLRMHDSLQHE